MARSRTRFLIAVRSGALRYDQGGGHEGAADKLDRGHAIAEEQPDRSPPVQITSHGFERVEGRDQDQARDRSMPGEICGDRSADAEADRNDALAGLRSHQMVEDHE